MPLIEYRFTDKLGNRRVVERLYRKIEDAPDKIIVEESDTNYFARKIEISLTASQATNWSVGTGSVDLPAENTPFIPAKDK